MVSETVTIKPDLRVIHPEYGDMTEDVARAMAEIRAEDHAKLIRDAERMQAAITAARPGDAYIQKNFALKAEIHPAIFAHWRMKHGKEFWKHEMDWFLKKNPQCRVRSRSQKTTLNLGTLPPSQVSGLSLQVSPSRPRVVGRGRWSA